MGNLFSLLNIDEGMLRDFHLQAGRVGDLQTERVINQNTRKLREIEDSMVSDKSIQVSKKSIDEVIAKVKDLSAKNDLSPGNWTMRELRIVSYYMSQLLDDENAFIYALLLLENDWRNMYFNGLMFFVLDKWNMMDVSLRKATTNLIIKKLNNYQDHNKRYVTLKSQINFLEEAGPLRLGILLASKQQDVREAPLVLGYKQSAFQQSYFSDVIVNYVKRLSLNDLDTVEEIFEDHNLDRTKKLVFADFVIRANSTGDAALQSQLSRFINRTLGDVTLASTWAPFAGATQAEADALRMAKNLVNLWFTRKIIETFFEVCVQDRERKNFWLNYVDHVKSFKIVGSKSIKYRLQGDSRIGTMFYPHFIETNSRYSQTAALILYIRNKVIIEFSDLGALYVYNEDHRKVEFIRKGKRYIESTDDLKLPSMGNIVDIYDWSFGFNEEGKMRHAGNWTSRLTMWINKILLGTPDNSSFRNSSEGSIFTAKPIVTRPTHSTTSSTRQEDLPEYLRSNSASPTFSSKPIITPPPTLSTERTYDPLSPVEYETHTQFNLSSKWVDGVRIVCGQKGFFMNVKGGTKFVFIGNLKYGCRPQGSIWIKKPSSTGWMTIAHAAPGQEYTVGYMRIIKGDVFFRDSTINPAKQISIR